MENRNDTQKMQRSMGDKFEDLLIKSEKRMIPVLICFTLFLVLINLLWGSDRLVYAASENCEYELITDEGCGPITLADRVTATIKRVETVSYNASYWKTRVFYNNLYQMCADKGIVREKLNSLIKKLTGTEIATEGAGYLPERITPFELGIIWDDTSGGEEY